MTLDDHIAALREGLEDARSSPWIDADLALAAVCAASLPAVLSALAEARGAVMENTHLRVLANSAACSYGHRAPGGYCELGYPGCACMDDLLALQAWCPEDEEKAAVRIGRRLAEAEQRLAEARGALEEIEAGPKEMSEYWHPFLRSGFGNGAAWAASIARAALEGKSHDR